MSSTLVDLRYPFREELFNKRVDLVERGIWDSPSLVVPDGVATLDEDRARRWARGRETQKGPPRSASTKPSRAEDSLPDSTQAPLRPDAL